MLGVAVELEWDESESDVGGLCCHGNMWGRNSEMRWHGRRVTASGSHGTIIYRLQTRSAEFRIIIYGAFEHHAQLLIPH
jgi:hypothetical protein